MTFSFDSSLFTNNPHNPSMRSLKESMGENSHNLLDFCVPVNNGFPPQEFIDDLKANLDEALKFYPSDNATLTKPLGDLVGVEPKNLVLGNGSTELITWIIQLFVKDSFVTPVPTFGRWTDVPLDFKKTAFFYARDEERNFELSINHFVSYTKANRISGAVICNPNNPTGHFLNKEEMFELLDQLRHMDVVVIDESFIDFSSKEEVESVADLIEYFPNLIVLKSLGKNFGLHGIRFGYAVATEERAEKLRSIVPRWNINGIGEYVIRNIGQFKKEYEQSRSETINQTKYLEHKLQSLPGVKVFPSRANFVYLKLPQEIRGAELRNYLLQEQAILIRSCENKIGSSEQFLRLSTRNEAEVLYLVHSMRRAFQVIKRPATNHKIAR